MKYVPSNERHLEVWWALQVAIAADDDIEYSLEQVGNDENLTKLMKAEIKRRKRREKRGNITTKTS